MPLPSYGVLIGKLNHFEREPPDHFGRFFHGFLFVDAPLGQYKCAVDVATPAGINVEHRELHGLNKQLFASITNLPKGWHLLHRDNISGALDYVRSPVLNKSLFKKKQDSGWIQSNGENALNAMESLFKDVSKIFVFGAPFNTGLGVHDIHMNQGDPPGPFQSLDATWQDGAVVIKKKNGQLNCFLCKFETQSLHTDNNGLPVP